MTPALPEPETPRFSVDLTRSDVPQLQMQVRGKSLVYLDNGATTLRPQSVINRVSRYYFNENSNVHRGAHYLAETGTYGYESARATVAHFLGVDDKDEIIFTRGTTESLNLIAASLSDSDKIKNRQIVISEMEHHSNIVPWQLAAKRCGATIKAVRIDEKGRLDLDHLQELLQVPTSVVAITACSNVLGTIIPVADISPMVHDAGALLIVDAAQSVTAEKIDVQKWGADAVAFSGHKVFGPFGIGVLWAKKFLLEELPPYQGGGSMIDQVHIESSTWADVPQKFEAGTPNVAGALGLEAGIQWFNSQAPLVAMAHAKEVAEIARVRLTDIPGITIYGGASKRTSLLSFNLDGVHASDLATVLDQQGVAVRSGHMCCQPLMRRLGVSSVVRASFSIYNTRDEVESLVTGVHKAKEMLT